MFLQHVLPHSMDGGLLILESLQLPDRIEGFPEVISGLTITEFVGCDNSVCAVLEFFFGVPRRIATRRSSPVAEIFFFTRILRSMCCCRRDLPCGKDLCHRHLPCGKDILRVMLQHYAAVTKFISFMLLLETFRAGSGISPLLLRSGRRPKQG